MAAPKRQSVRSNRVCFTLNFKEEGTWPTSVLEEVQASLGKSHEDGALQYACVGKEVAPTTGVHHLQGFIAMQPTALRASDGLVGTWKKLFPFLARAHLETARGTDAQNKEYCSKTGDVFLELGTPKLTISLKDFAGLTWKDQMDADPEMAIKSRFQLDSILKRQRAEELQLMIQEQKRKKFSQPLRPWQQTLVDRLLTQPDRHVFFVIDPTGNTGKSYLAMWLQKTHNAFICRSGKDADIAFAFEGHHTLNHATIAVFDMARCRDEQYWPFHMMECMKDGQIFSAKYESKSFECLEQKIVVFANQEPDMSKLSHDRFVKFIIEDNKLVEQY